MRLGLAASAIGVGWLFLGAVPAASATEAAPSSGLLGAVSSTVEAVAAPVSTLVAGTESTVSAVAAPVATPVAAPAVAPAAATPRPLVPSPVVAPVAASVTETVGDIASARTVTSVVSPVADAADDLISALPVVDSVLGRAPVGSIADPVSDGLDDLLDTTAGLVTPRIDDLGEASDELLTGPIASRGLIASGDGDPTATAGYSALRTASLGGRRAASASISALPFPPVSGIQTGGTERTPHAPFVFAAVGSSGTASAGSVGGQPTALVALTSEFSFTLAVGIRSPVDDDARAFSLSYDPGSSPD